MTDPAPAGGAARDGAGGATSPALSLGTAAARNLATTTKTPPQMRGRTPRWLLRVLPWEQVRAGSYRVNRRRPVTVSGGRLSFTAVGADVRVVPAALRQLPALRELADENVLTDLAGRFVRRELAPGEVLATSGQPVDALTLVAHGKLHRIGTAKYGGAALLGVLAEGDHLGESALLTPGSWPYTVRAATRCVVLTLGRRELAGLAERSRPLREHLERVRSRPVPAHNSRGEADVELASGHAGEPDLPGTYVDYELVPREYELSVAQTVLRVHTRVADLYNEPMNQVEQQLRLTVEALRERQEHELVNNPQFGLLTNADAGQRISTRTGPPTPDDLDELLCRRRKSRYFVAHPLAIAAFHRQCSRRGVYPATTELDGRPVPAWRGVPLLPCDKIPVDRGGVTSIMVMRTGVASEGVVGLHQAGIPAELEPSLNARFMGADRKGVVSYLVSAYFSAVVLVPDALGVLENVELGGAA